MDIGILITLLSALVATASSYGINEAMDYFTKFNYFDPADQSSGHLRSSDSVNQAVRLFQRMNGLNETGIMDDEVKRLMQMPRCGLPDNTGTQAIGRARRYALSDVKWNKKDLTWKMENFTPDLSTNKVRDIIARALKHWSDASQLTFREVRSGSADLMIKFARASHGDGNPFDGESGVLAHAYFPSTDRGFSIAGDAHFDEDEFYTDGSYQGTNLFQVAVHEFGHSLGLGHSSSPDAIMAAIYRGYVPNARLHSDDVAGIQALYGANSGTPEVEGTEGPKVTGDCVANFVAASQTATSGSFLFNDTHAFEMDIYGIVGSPRRIGSVFRGLPDHLDASFYYEQSRKTYFFKGSQYWRYSDLNMDRGYPRLIQDGFGYGMPSDIDAAFVWSGNGKTYFIKDDQYYRFNFRTASLDTGYPKSLSVWNGIGTKVDAAFQFENKVTYFFSDGEYRRFDDNRFAVSASYPRRSTLWLKCEESSLVATQAAAKLEYTTVDSGSASSSRAGSLAVPLFASVVLALTQL